MMHRLRLLPTSWAMAGAAVAVVLLVWTAPGRAQGAGAAAQGYRETISGTLVSFEMVLVPGGMVTIDGRTETVDPFYLARTETTWDMYDIFALGLDRAADSGAADAIARPSQPYGAPDYGWGHAGYPAISVTRAAAEAFCEWLSAKTGKRYRLPTEAEWVHAATLAAGPEPPTAARLDAIAWHRDNAGGTTHPSGRKAADALGLYDLFGNAGEWVTTRDGALVLRGGSFRDPPEHLGPRARATQTEAWNERDPQLPKSRWWLSDAPFAGFRVAASIR